MTNLRLAFRALARTPIVTGVAVLSLALGIGANVAIFSLFDFILLRPLPVAEPERLVNLAAPGPKPGATNCNQAGDCGTVFSYPMFRDLEEASTGAFSGLAAHRAFGANLAFRAQTVSGEGMLVSGSYFPVLGVLPALGRLLGPADDRTVGGHPVAVLSHRFWTTQLGSSADVLDGSILINGHPFTIVGVAPEGFEGTTLGSRPAVFVPITMAATVSHSFESLGERTSYWAYLFGRLAPGVSIAQAAGSINAVYRPIIQEIEAPLQPGMSDRTMERFLARKVTLEPGWRGQSSAHGLARTPLILLFCVTAVVLLIACANLANLLLARGASRASEMAVRLALGASRRNVVGQLLTESVVLTSLGGAASLIVADWTLAGMAGFVPPQDATLFEVELRPPIIAFTIAVSLSTALLFGLFPALHSTRTDLISTIRANAGQVTGAAARFRTVLVTAQIALSMALLVSAGLFLRSLTNIARVDLGLDVDNLITFTVAPGLSGYEPARARIFFDRLEDELSTAPGVSSVAAAMIPILSGYNWGSDVSVEGFERAPETDTNSSFNPVSPGYFRTLGIPLLAGRDFAAADDLGAPPVAIVNRAFAERFGLGMGAVGKYMARGDTDSLNVQIVGVVENARYAEVKDAIQPVFYTPYRQEPNAGVLTFYVQTPGDPRAILRTIPPAVAGLDPSLPVENLKTMQRVVRENVSLDRMITTLSAAFAALATLLAAIGLYGVLAYSVAQRTREIGVRIALGASRHQIQRMVFRQVAAMLAIGGVLGMGAALGVERAARSLLFNLEGAEPLAFVAALTFLGMVAFAAGYLPARRAAKVEPMNALRYE